MSLGLSERRACRLAGIGRSSRRYVSRPDKNARLAERLREVVRTNTGYRHAWGTLKDEFAPLNRKRVHRLFKQLKLSVPKRKFRKVRTGRPLPMRAERPNHVWCVDFCHDACLNGTKLKILTVKDEFTKECLALEVSTSLPSRKVREVLSNLFAERGVPGFVRSDNGPEFTCRSLRVWLRMSGSSSRFIMPGRPWQNGCAESFISRFRAEFLDVEAFCNLADAQVRIALWRNYYNDVRPHSALGYLSPRQASLRQACNQEKSLIL